MVMATDGNSRPSTDRECTSGRARTGQSICTTQCFMNTELAQNRWQTAAVVAEMTAAAVRELGLRGVASRIVPRAAAPLVKWGAITFFERALDGQIGRASCRE